MGFDSFLQDLAAKEGITTQILLTFFLFITVATIVIVGTLIASTKVHIITTVGRKSSRRVTTILFVLIILVAGVGTVSSSWIPQSAFSDVKPSTTVDVIAKQFTWTLGDTNYRVRQPIMFKAISEDVTHGFGVYGPDGTIQFQMQVTSGKDNSFIFVFTEPGTYTVRCMEFCGIGHQSMITEFKVVDE